MRLTDFSGTFFRSPLKLEIFFRLNFGAGNIWPKFKTTSGGQDALNFSGKGKKEGNWSTTSSQKLRIFFRFSFGITCCDFKYEVIDRMRRRRRRLRQLLRRVVESVDDLGHGCDGLDGGVVGRIPLGAFENDQHSRLLRKQNNKKR